MEIARSDQELLNEIQQASAEMDVHRVAIRRLAIRRANALAELRRRRPAAWIADQLGITRQQVHRLLREALGRDYQPED